MVEESKSKCGEIFRIDNGSYIFICFHCGAEFQSSSDIVEHIEKHFLWNPLPFAAAFNFTVNVKLEDESKEIAAESFSHTTNEFIEPKIEVEEENEEDNDDNELIKQSNDDESDHWPGDLFDLDEKEDKNVSTEIVKGQPVKLNVTKVRKKRLTRSNKSPLLLLSQNINRKGKRKSIFICETCGKQFDYKSKIRDHVTMHVNIISAPPPPPPQHYQCDVCSATFNKKISLRIHLSRHRSEDFHINGPMK